MLTSEEYIKNIKNKYPLKEIERILSSLSSLRVLVIGDTIIDQYIYIRPKGRAIKDPILSAEYVSDEIYAGGVLAVANHVQSFVKDVTLVTILGDKNSDAQFITNSLANNITLKTFRKPNAPTTRKTRFLDSVRGNKLFKVEYMNDHPIEPVLSASIITMLEKTLSSFDLVLVADFGHGFINDDIRKTLEKHTKFLAINVQSNSANMGYNFFTQYKHPNFISLDEDELRLPLQMRFNDIEEVITKAQEQFALNALVVTLGKRGSIYVKNETRHFAPVLTNTVKDTIGAGDALFAITSLVVCAEINDDLIPLLANSAGGIAVNIIGNKEAVSKDKIISFIRGAYDGVA